ncbi:hypothetical protein MKK88_14410 [Methylobacterium sp. E-005]|uniref:hypothetical protein n=1 Tax=Methylobacterium sp. E-005 TaxID=2836549 RepID=UPI001FB8F583|nr:hypothetical protein [Methylobacterium sp. E-005]MCJ2087169.1 hypothetical protein [Methylobacterium sp. E-005]
MTHLVSDAECAVLAREAAAAIEAVLDQRCPELKRAFWSAVEKHYRWGPQAGAAPPEAPKPSLEMQPPA